MPKNEFFSNVSKFFKNNTKKDLIRQTDNGINILNQKKSEDEKDKAKIFNVFRNYFQARNWSNKHIELFDEYRRMDNNFPIISAALKIFSQETCLTGDTKIDTPSGLKRIDDLYSQNLTDFYVKALDYENNIVTWGICKKIVCNGTKEVYKVVLRNNNSFKCTDNHRIRLNDGSFKELKELKQGDYISTFYYDKNPECSCLEPRFSLDEIISINKIGEELVYDLIDVFPNNHFLIYGGNNLYAVVHNCTKGTDGNVLTIHSDNDRIKECLNELFFKNLKLNSQSYLHVKQFLKFGNHYAYLQTRQGVGVLDLLHLPPETIRIELLQNNFYDLNQFKYLSTGIIGNIQFDPWELVHWKFIDDLETEPYGQSILRSVVDTYRRIILMREALIIYRITRAPQRFLFKLDAGNLDPDAAILYADEIKKQMYKDPLINPKTGEMDYKYSPLTTMENIYMTTSEGDATDVRVLEGACLVGETVLRTSNGNMTIHQLSEFFIKEKKKLYSLSVNKHNKIVSGKILWCEETKRVKELYEITLQDNLGKFHTERCTDNHPFMLSDRTYKKAGELIKGMELKGIIEEYEYTVYDVRLVILDEAVPVYDLEVEEYHNFCLGSGIFVHNSNLDQIEDYKIIKDDLFAGLMIPKQYLQFDEVQTAKAALVQEDIRFANLIKQIQAYYLEGLIHIALVHLILNGFSNEDLDSFTLEMNTNSTFAEKTRKELLEQRFAIASMAWQPDTNGLNLMSYTAVLKDILKFSDSEIDKMIQDQFIEKKLAWRLAELQENGQYQEPEADKQEREAKEKEASSVFKNLKFESYDKDRDSAIGKILTSTLKEEIKELLKPVTAKPTKKQITMLKENYKFNDVAYNNLMRAKKDLGMQ